jgi:hypothetical protein
MTDLLILIAVAAAAAAIGIWLGIVLIARPINRVLDADEDRGAAPKEDANGRTAPGD